MLGRPIDTCVVLLTVAIFQPLDLDQILDSLVQENILESIATGIAEIKAKALPMFQAFTGCDTSTHFHYVARNQHGIHGYKYSKSQTIK